MKRRMSKKQLANALVNTAIVNSNRLYHGLSRKTNKVFQRDKNVLVNLTIAKLTKNEIKSILSQSPRVYEGRIYGRDQIRISFDEGYFVLVVAQPHQSVDAAINRLIK